MRRILVALSCVLYMSVAAYAADSKTTGPISESNLAAKPAKATAKWKEKNKVPPGALQEAERRLGRLRNLSEKDIGEYFMIPYKSLQTASLGAPIRQHIITEKTLRSYKAGDTVPSMLSDTDMWLFPVLADNRVSAILHIEKASAGHWKMAQMSQGQLALELDKILAEWPESKGCTLVFVSGGDSPLWDFGWFFFIPEKGDYNLTKVKLPSDKMAVSYSQLGTPDKAVEFLLARIADMRRAGN